MKIVITFNLEVQNEERVANMVLDRLKNPQVGIYTKKAIP